LFPLMSEGDTRILSRAGHRWRPSINVSLPQHQPPTKEKHRLDSAEYHTFRVTYYFLFPDDFYPSWIDLWFFFFSEQ
jgi:hypothetical protein